MKTSIDIYVKEYPSHFVEMMKIKITCR